jgi:putative nucleotidyltransferase with HDIG domain
MGSINQTITSIFELFNTQGGDMYIGEPVTKYQHMVQSACIAQNLGYSDELVIAALLHDIGHVCVELTPENDMDGFGVKDHDKVGAAFLRAFGFSDLVISAVENHVDAKRYLCTTDKDYYNQLSEASLETLKFQGGLMTEAEILDFENHPFFIENIQIRKIDEMAKDPHMKISPVESFEEILHNHLTPHA